jgi:transposase-like protein
LSASAIGRLKDGWLDEHAAWQKRDLSAKRYVYIWADGIHLQARLEDEKQCILVLIGTTPEGRKELVGFTDGARESAQDWRDLLLDLKRRGLDVPPRLAIADGALGFWKAAGEVWPKTREQRCWVHKTANVIAKLPKSQQPKPNARCRRSGWPKPGSPPSWRSTPSSRATRPNTRRRPTA